MKRKYKEVNVIKKEDSSITANKNNTKTIVEIRRIIRQVETSL